MSDLFCVAMGYRGSWGIVLSAVCWTGQRPFALVCHAQCPNKTLGARRGVLEGLFSFFSSVSIIHFATISVVCVVMDIFLNQGASKLFIDFCFVFAEVRNSGGFCTCACVLLLRWS